MEVQFTTPTAGRELNEVADLPDNDAQWLLAQGAVRIPGSKQLAQGVMEGSPNLAVVREVDPHRTVPDFGDDAALPDIDERANPQSGKGATPIPEQVVQGEHPFEGERNPFEDESSDENAGLEGMSARELKSYIERINNDDPQAKLQPSGNRSQLLGRIREYESTRQADQQQSV